jgi:hypothetical protein
MRGVGDAATGACEGVPAQAAKHRSEKLSIGLIMLLELPKTPS